MPQFKPFPFTIDGGMNTRDIPSKIKDNQAVLIQNMEYDSGNNISTVPGYDLICADSFATIITSMYNFIKTNDKSFIVISVDKNHSGTEDDLYVLQIPAAISDTMTKITPAALHLKNALTDWYYATFDDHLIAVNGATTASAKDNNLFWDGVLANDAIKASTVTTGTMAKGKYIAVWNQRVFVVDADNPNTVAYSKLGDYLNWSDATVGIKAGNFSIDDNDKITGLWVWRDRLVVFKSRSIHVVTPGDPNTDPDLWNVKPLTLTTGLVSQRSVANVLDDVVFLSPSGVRSLRAVQEQGEFKQDALSRDIDELYRQPPQVSAAAYVDTSKAQYVLFTKPSTAAAGDKNSIAWVMDYSRAMGGSLTADSVRWTKRTDASQAGIEGIELSTSSDIQTIQPRIYFVGQLAGESPSWAVVRQFIVGEVGTSFPLAGIYQVFGNAISTRIITKVYSLGSLLINKIFNKVGAAIKLLWDTVDINFSYTLDEIASKTKNVTYELLNYTSVTTTTFDTSLSTTVTTTVTSFLTDHREIKKKMYGNPGRRGNSIQLTIGNASVSQGWLLKEIEIDATLINQRGINDATSIDER